MIIDALTRLHYGSPFLDAVIKSTEGFAGRHWVIYAEHHNFPGDPTMPCPDTREQLLSIAQAAGGDRLQWVDHPNPGVDVVLREHPEIDALLELDSDEVIHQDLARDIKEKIEAGTLTSGRYRLPFLHHWRAFKYGCTDSQWPIRLYLPHAGNNDEAWWEHTEPRRYVHHFGYVQPRAHMDYKWMLSIHKSDLRPEWFAEIYNRFPERLIDLHPVSVDMWNAELIPDGDLPAALMGHPYRYLEVVE